MWAWIKDQDNQIAVGFLLICGMMISFIFICFSTPSIFRGGFEKRINDISIDQQNLADQYSEFLSHINFNEDKETKYNQHRHNPKTGEVWYPDNGVYK